MFCSRCQIVVCLADQIPWDSSSSARPCLERMGKSQSKMTEEDFAFVVKHSTLGPGEIKVLSTLSQQTMYHWIQHLIIMLWFRLGMMSSLPSAQMEKSTKKNLSPCIRSLLLPSKKQCKHENHHINSVFQCWLERSFQDVRLLWHWPHWISELQVRWKLSSIHLCLLRRLPQRVDDGSPSGGTVEHGREVGTSLQRDRQLWQWKPLLQRDQGNDLCSEGSGLFSICFLLCDAFLWKRTGDLWEVWQEQRRHCDQGGVCQCAERGQRYCGSSSEIIQLIEWGEVFIVWHRHTQSFLIMKLNYCNIINSWWLSNEPTKESSFSSRACGGGLSQTQTDWMNIGINRRQHPLGRGC